MNLIDIILIILIICFVLLKNKMNKNRNRNNINKKLTNEKIIMINRRRLFSLSLSELEF